MFSSFSPLFPIGKIAVQAVVAKPPASGLDKGRSRPRHYNPLSLSNLLLTSLVTASTLRSTEAYTPASNQSSHSLSFTPNPLPGYGGLLRNANNPIRLRIEAAESFILK